MTDHVIFRYDPEHQPEITFRGVPSGCAGGANTLGEARTSYRTCLSARLHVDRRSLPTIVEHIEGLVCGMWVRCKVGAVHRDTSTDKMLLQILLSERVGLRDEVSRLTEAGADPVVVLTEPDHPLQSVVDQMAERDSLVVAHSDGNGSIGWGVLYGPKTVGGCDVPHLDEAEVTTMPVETFTQIRAGVGGVVQRRPAADIAS